MLLLQLFNPLAQQNEQPDEGSGEDRMTQTCNMRQEADVRAVDLQHTACSHGTQCHEEANVIHDIPSAERFGLVNLEQLGEDQHDQEEYKSENQDMGMKPDENGVPGKIIMLGYFAVEETCNQSQYGVKE